MTMSVIENSVNLDAVNLDALYVVKLIFSKYFCYFNSNCVAVLLQLQLCLVANRVPVREGVNNSFHTHTHTKKKKTVEVYKKPIYIYTMGY